MLILILCCAGFFSACTSALPQAPSDEVHYLALGDSYTIGQSVSPEERWPEQFAGSLETRLSRSIVVEYRARTGWTSDELISSLRNTATDRQSYDLVSLLIGVNNQFRGYDFSRYTSDVPELIDRALEFTEGQAERVFVLSIPDYGYTAYGSRIDPQERAAIEHELNAYNSWMKTYVENRGIAFFEITDITRRGITNPELIADDGLHPSGEAYRLFAERIILNFDVEIFR